MEVRQADAKVKQAEAELDDANIEKQERDELERKYEDNELSIKETEKKAALDIEDLEVKSARVDDEFDSAMNAASKPGATPDDTIQAVKALYSKNEMTKQMNQAKTKADSQIVAAKTNDALKLLHKNT